MEKYKFLGRYRKDPKAIAALIAVLLIGALFLWAEPSFWPYVCGYWALVILIAYLKRNSP